MRAASLLLRIVVTVAMLALIVNAVDVAQIRDVLARAQPALLAGALALQLASGACAGYRWYLMMDNLRFRQTPGFYLRSFLKSLFFNQALPGVGGDAFRVIDVARHGFRKRDVLLAVLLDRLLGLAALVTVSLLAAAMNPAALPRSTTIALASSMALVLAVLSAALWIGILPWPARTSRPVVLMRQISERARLALSRRRVGLLATCLLSPLLAVLCFYVAGLALGLTHGLSLYFAVVPPALVLSAVPVSIAGWGIREGALFALFALAGGEPAAAVTLSITYGVMVIVASLPGLPVFLAERQGRHSLPAASGRAER